MKLVIFSVIIFFSLVAFGQPDPKEVCHITYVNGLVKRSNNKILARKDTIGLTNLSKLRFESKDAYLSIFSYSYGCVKIGQKESDRLSSHKNNLIEFVAELMEIKGTTVPLYSRGDCKCLTPVSCFSTDTLLNNRVMVLDSIMFQVDPGCYKGSGGFDYFTQFIVNQRKVTRVLKMENGLVTIRKRDYRYDDSLYFNFESPALIGIIRYENDKSQVEQLCKVRFNFCDAQEIWNYYQDLQFLMGGYNPGIIYEEFVRSVYAIYGKPELCSLNRLINY